MTWTRFSARTIIAEAGQTIITRHALKVLLDRLEALDREK
jgi:hypothetical protein